MASGLPGCRALIISWTRLSWPGTSAHQLAKVEAMLAGLPDCFATVFFVPGNHELWVRGEGGNSLEKFDRLISLCHKLGVHTTMRTCAWPTIGAVGPMRWRKSPEIYS